MMASSPLTSVRGDNLNKSTKGNGYKCLLVRGASRNQQWNGCVLDSCTLSALAGCQCAIHATFKVHHTNATRHNIIATYKAVEREK